jgi:hypothetical protein
VIDPNNTSDVSIESRTGDGVLANPTWINRGLGYRTASTRVTVTGNGYADVIPSGKFIVINDLETYPGPGAQLTIQGFPSIYTLVTVTPIGQTDRGLAARVRISPEIKVRDNLQHLTPISIRTRYSQCRITGHDFLDIGTGNFEETNYPELYNTGEYVPAPENEIVEDNPYMKLDFAVFHILNIQINFALYSSSCCFSGCCFMPWYTISIFFKELPLVF